MSRAELAKQTGLTKATMSLLVSMLVDNGVVREGTPSVQSSYGRPSTPLLIVGGRYCGIGLQVNTDGYGTIVLDLDGTVVAERWVDADMSDVDADDIRACTKAQAAALFKTHFWDKLNCKALSLPLAVTLYDGAVNMGGFVAMRSEELYKKAMSFSIMFEGYVTYGGMSGRDMDALAVGLDENTEFGQLDARIRQVRLLGDLLDQYGVPYQRPAGGHAIFVDAKKALPNLPKEQFIAQTLAVELYLEAGIRGVEIGSILADRDPETHENRYPALELLRLAIPRRVYSDNHIRVIAAACRNIFERRAEITTGYRIAFEAPILRHFTVELEKI
ncbi:MAG: hypothetical protein EGP78_03040 [Alistipes shahii]|nr:hypothetical protein [Alistipes shahii]